MYCTCSSFGKFLDQNYLGLIFIVCTAKTAYFYRRVPKSSSSEDRGGWRLAENLDTWENCIQQATVSSCDPVGQCPGRADARYTNIIELSSEQTVQLSSAHDLQTTQQRSSQSKQLIIQISSRSSIEWKCENKQILSESGTDRQTR